MASARHDRRGALGLAIAVLAFCLQLGAAALHPPEIAQAPRPYLDLALLIEPHALCLSANAGERAAGERDDGAPAAPAGHFPGCCPWHGSGIPGLPLPSVVIAFAFAEDLASLPVAAGIAIRPRPPGTAGARAPPSPA